MKNKSRKNSRYFSLDAFDYMLHKIQLKLSYIMKEMY